MTSSIIFKIQQMYKENNTLGGFSLEHFEAEKQVLKNINNIKLMECLGLKDKLGLKIHFGDILIDEANGTLLTPVIEVANAEHIIYFKPLKHLNSKFPIGCKSTYSNTLRVIGNLYTNSELFIALTEHCKIVNLVISTNSNNDNYDTTIQIRLEQTVYN